jgi:hypothetical protein
MIVSCCWFFRFHCRTIIAVMMGEPASSERVPRIHKVKRANSNRLRRSFVISSCFSLFAAVLCLVALQMPHWFITVTSTSTKSYGIDSVCTDALCVSRTYSNMDLGLCVISGPSFDNRSIAVRWLLYTGIGLALLSVPLYFVATFRKQSFLLPALCAQLFAFLCNGACIVLFVIIFQNWLFCGNSFCKYVYSQSGTSSTPCFATYGTGYIMAACAACLLFVGFVFAVGALIVQRRRESALQLVLVSRNAQYDAPTDFEAPEGFLFDPSCGLYYSDDVQLYLDPESCHYYDPARGLWYDTSADRWYEIEEN